MKQWLVLLGILMPCVLDAAPMVVNADQFELVQGEQRAVFTGHVVATQDDLLMKADQMTLWYVQDEMTGKKKLNHGKAVGNVWLQTKESTGSAQQATFAADSEILVLQGKARMISESGVVEGEYIEYHMQTKDTQVLKGTSREQVRFTFDE